jgi:diacylglycerol kinase (ATP)
MKKILVFVNPNARQGAGIGDEIKEWLKTEGFEVLDSSFDSKKEGICDVILRYQAEKSYVLLGGGDGTVNEALPAILKTGSTVLLIPLGTANNLARTLGIPTDYKAALELIKTGRLTDIDVGMVNKIPFVNVIGLGLSTQVNRMVRKETKKWFGVFAFVATALKVALRMTPFHVKIESDGKIHKAYSWQVTICNGRNYGSGLTVHEDASLFDEKLHGLSTEVRRWWHTFLLIPALMTGKFKAEDDVTLLEGAVIKVKTRFPMHVDVDGDIKTKTPLEISVQPRAMKIFIP